MPRFFTAALVAVCASGFALHAAAQGPLYPDKFGDAQLKQALDALGIRYTPGSFSDGQPYYYAEIPDAFQPTATKGRKFFAYSFECASQATGCEGIHFSFHDPIGAPSLQAANEFATKHYNGHIIIDSNGAGLEDDHIAADGITQGNAIASISAFVDTAITYLKSREGTPVASASPSSIPGLSGLSGLRSAFAGAAPAAAAPIPSSEAAYIEGVRSTHRR